MNTPFDMHKSLQITPRFHEKEIQKKVQELACQITERFRPHPSKEKRALVAICVLNGGILFFADLLRAIDLDLECDFLGVS